MCENDDGVYVAPMTNQEKVEAFSFQFRRMGCMLMSHMISGRQVDTSYLEDMRDYWSSYIVHRSFFLDMDEHTRKAIGIPVLDRCEPRFMGLPDLIVYLLPDSFELDMRMGSGAVPVKRESIELTESGCFNPLMLDIPIYGFLLDERQKC